MEHNVVDRKTKIFNEIGSVRAWNKSYKLCNCTKRNYTMVMFDNLSSKYLFLFIYFRFREFNF